MSAAERPVPTVSIAVPAYNRPTELRWALASMPRATYVRRAHNMGLVENALLLREEATGDYFMWLADDDEITPNYVSSLVALLEQNPDAVTAMGHWGQVLAADPSVRWISHNYTHKHYRDSRLGVGGVLSLAVRRINVHASYWAKSVRRLNPTGAPAVIAVSVASLVRDSVLFVFRRARQFVRKAARLRRAQPFWRSVA